MNKIKWTMLLSIILVSNHIRKIVANSDAVTSKQASDCYDPYGRPQVSTISYDFYRLTKVLSEKQMLELNLSQRMQKNKRNSLLNMTRGCDTNVIPVCERNVISQYISKFYS